MAKRFDKTALPVTAAALPRRDSLADNVLTFNQTCAILQRLLGAGFTNVTDLKDAAWNAILRQGATVDVAMLDRALDSVLTARDKTQPQILPTFTRTIQARPTGQFRSRLESQWAAALDALGLRWDYEPRLFSEIPYLPDFYLPNVPAWLEVKPTAPDRGALTKARQLSDLVLEPVYILTGPPGRTSSGAPAFMSFHVSTEHPDGMSDFGWIPAAGCSALKVMTAINWQLVSDTLFRSRLGPHIEPGQITARRRQQQQEARREARSGAEREGDALPSYLREHVRRDGLEDVPPYLREHVRAGEDPDDI